MPDILWDFDFVPMPVRCCQNLMNSEEILARLWDPRKDALQAAAVLVP
jgi:hypothetical protein